MGVCASKSVAEVEARRKDAEILALARADHEKEANKVKLLLLGAGESGKSTVFKQMRILYGTGYGEADRRQMGPVIQSNLIVTAKILISMVEELGFRLDDGHPHTHFADNTLVTTAGDHGFNAAVHFNSNREIESVGGGAGGVDGSNTNSLMVSSSSPSSSHPSTSPSNYIPNHSSSSAAAGQTGGPHSSVTSTSVAAGSAAASAAGSATFDHSSMPPITPSVIHPANVASSSAANTSASDAGNSNSGAGAAAATKPQHHDTAGLVALSNIAESASGVECDVVTAVAEGDELAGSGAASGAAAAPAGPAATAGAASAGPADHAQPALQNGVPGGDASGAVVATKHNSASNIVNTSASSSAVAVTTATREPLPGSAAAAAVLLKDVNEDRQIDASIANMIETIWNDAASQAAYAQRSSFQLPDSTAHFIGRVRAIATPGYIPTLEDVLHTRVRTTGILSEEYLIENVTFAIYDVGGQKNERRKWLHAFDDVTAIIFVAAISEYDQVMFEDSTQNRLMDALNLFEGVVNNKIFENTPVILFLNKRDLFQQKIARIDLRQRNPNPALAETHPFLFEDYTGGCDEGAAMRYIVQQFLSRVKNPKETFWKVTCATDTENIKTVFNAAKQIILRDNLVGSLGLDM